MEYNQHYWVIVDKLNGWEIARYNGNNRWSIIGQEYMIETPSLVLINKTPILSHTEKNVVINIDTLIDKCFMSADGTVIDKEEISKRIIEVLNII